MSSRSLGTLTLDLVARIGGFTQSMNQAAQVVDSRMKSMQESAEKAKRALTSVFAVTLGGMTVKGLADMADQYGQMASRIKMATTSVDEYNQVQQRLLQTANITFRPLQEAQELYIRTADSIKSLGYNTEQALDITDSYSYLLVTNAASADRANTAISSLSKSIQTGKVSALSWQTILAATPTIVDSIANSTGKTTAEIRKLGVEGKLSLNDLLEGLRKNVDANKKLAEGMSTSLNDALVKFKNNLSAFVGEQNRAYGVTAALADAISVLGNNIHLLAAGAFVLVAGKLGAMTSNLAASSIAWVKNTAATVQNTIAGRDATDAKIQTLIATQRQAQALAAQAQQLRVEAVLNEVATRGTLQHAAALNTLAAARRAEVAANLKAVQATQALNTAQSVGVGGIRALVGILGGPVGLGLTVASVAAGWLTYKSNAQQAVQANIDLSQSTEELNQKLKEMNQNQLSLAVEDLKQQSKDAAQAIDDAYSQLRGIANKNSAGSEQYLDKLFAEYRAGERDISNLVDTYLKFTNADKQVQAQFRLAAQSLDDQNNKYSKLQDWLTQTIAKLNNTATVAPLAKQALQDVFSLNPEQAKQYNTMLGNIQNRILALQDPTGMLALKKSLADSKIPENSKEWQVIIADQEKLIALQKQSTQLKSSTKSDNDIAKSYKDQVDQLNQQLALFNETSQVAKMRYELANGELKTLSDTQKQLLINKSIELDQLNARKEFDSLMKELRTDEEKARDTLKERVELLKKANIQGQKYADAMARINKASISEAPKFGGIDASVGGASGELLKVAEAQKELDKWQNQELERQADFLAKKELKEQQYAANVIEINKRTAESQQQLNDAWRNATLSTFASVTSDAASMLKELGGESSILYKTMFAVSKAASIAQAIINTEEAATKALAVDPTGIMSGITRGLGYASVGMIAATSIAGMAHSGIDNIPQEGTWLLDKNERVLSPRQNRDLTQFLEKTNNNATYNNATTNVAPQVNITINQDGSGDVSSTEGYENFGRQSFEAIRQIVLDVIIKQKRKGGQLDPNNRRA